MRQTEDTTKPQRIRAAGQEATGLAAWSRVAHQASGTDGRRDEAPAEIPGKLRGGGEGLAEVAHETRNMVTALGLYCDLLEEPGVLNPSFHHYAEELRLVATASRRLVEKLLLLDGRRAARPATAVIPLRSARAGAAETDGEVQGAGRSAIALPWESMPAEPIADLAAELRANRNLLAALAGPSISLSMEIEGSALPVRLSGEDLTRILVNLVKNAAEATPDGGNIELSLHEFHAGSDLSPWLVLTVKDTGRGIAREDLEAIFNPGYTTHGNGGTARGWAVSHRGLGLSITRSIVESAGGHIHAANRGGGGALFSIELPATPG
ncbi:MAG: sensor histidine kinase [Terracidiphilus sp.]